MVTGRPLPRDETPRFYEKPSEKMAREKRAAIRRARKRAQREGLIRKEDGRTASIADTSLRRGTSSATWGESSTSRRLTRGARQTLPHAAPIVPAMPGRVRE